MADEDPLFEPAWEDEEDDVDDEDLEDDYYGYEDDPCDCDNCMLPEDPSDVLDDSDAAFFRRIHGY